MKNIMAIALILVLLSGGTNFLEAQRKSTNVALALSIGAPTAVCLLAAGVKSPELFLGSVVVLPSAGHYYAGQIGTAFLFTGLRGATVAGGVVLFGSLVQSLGEEIEEGDAAWAGPILLGSAAAVGIVTLGMCVVISLVDWMYIPSSVDKYNERMQIRPEIDLKEKRYGIGFVYHFT
jgi:hypothetical protein